MSRSLRGRIVKLRQVLGLAEEFNPNQERDALGRFGSGGTKRASKSPEEKLAHFRTLKTTPDTKLKEYRATLDKKLSAEEKLACIEYSGEDYKAINGQLRGIEPEEPLSAHDRARLQETTYHLDRALDKAVTTEEQSVYRMMADEKILEGKGVGDSFLDKGFGSTSTGEITTPRFGTAVKLVLQIPKGSKAAAIPSLNPHEREVLLARNSRVEILAMGKEEGREGLTVWGIVRQDGVVEEARQPRLDSGRSSDKFVENGKGLVWIAKA